jgi:hypothetical protein
VHFPIIRAVLLAAVLTAGCSSAMPMTQTPYARVASEAASTFAAAAQTIEFVHAGRLTIEYGQAAAINYHEQVSEVLDQLAQLPGAPNGATVGQLAQLVAAAVADLQAPCLVDGCDWQTQVARLSEARDALLAAAE